MRLKTFLFYLLIPVCYKVSAQGRIGINTNLPQAMLHIKDSSVLFSGGALPVTPGNPPVSGQGVRMMWYPQKAAFRVGDAGGVHWNKDSIGLYSFGAGYATRAKGDYSFTAGESTVALGSRSVAMGGSSSAEDDYSIAIGRQVIASGLASMATGYGSNASGLAATAIGYFNNAAGSYTTSMGFSTVAAGQMSLATGYDTETDGVVSIAGGYRSVTTGDYSVALGFQSHSVPHSSFVIGRYNDESVGDNNEWIDTDPVFIIGNGADAATRSNAFTVLKNGKTAINSSNPLGALYIKAIGASENKHIYLEDDNSTDAGKIYYTGDLFFKNTHVNGDFYFRNDANANALSLFSTGNMTIAGSLTQNSDARLKKDFMPLESSLQKIVRLNGYHYRWIDSWRDKNIQTGFTAQEVEVVMPELVSTGDDGTKSVNYSGIIPYLVEAIKELKQQNDELKKEVEKLKRKN